MKTSSSFANPDFAFPKTVEATAEVKLKEAVAQKDYKTALRALVQLTIASTSISIDNADSSIALIEKTSASWPQPWKSMAQLIEANIYYDYYRRAEWKFSQRTLPLDEYPANIADWSKDLFCKKIVSILESAIAGASELGATPVKAAEGVVIVCADSVSAPTLLDFATDNAVDILSPFTSSDRRIPFFTPDKLSLGEDAGRLRAKWIDTLIDFQRKADRREALVHAFSLKAKTLNPTEAYAMLMAEGEKMSMAGDFSIAAKFMVEAYSYLYSPLGADEETAGLTPQSREKNFFDKAQVISEKSSSQRLASILKQMSAQSVTVSAKTQYLPGREIDIDVEWKNMPKVYVHLYRLPSYTKQSLTISTVLAQGKHIGMTALSTEQTVPFLTKAKGVLPAQEQGVYVALASSSAVGYRSVGDSMREHVNVFTVSNLALISSRDNYDSSRNRFYVVEGENQRPVTGANIVLTSDRRNSPKRLTMRSADDGSFEVPAGSFNIVVSKGSDVVRTSLYNGKSSYRDEKSLRATLFTDLGLYHPGDTVRYALMAWEKGNIRSALLPGHELRVEFRNASGQKIDTMFLKTDSDGRSNGFFKIPADGMLGNFSLTAYSGDRRVGWTSVTVADYKAPSFFVEVDSVAKGFTVGDTIRINGKVATYSGVPLGGMKVHYSIRYTTGWLWRYAETEASYASDCTTDEQGNFSIVLPTVGLKSTPFARGGYILNVEATSSSNETQAAAPVDFSIGDVLRIEDSLPSSVELTGDMRTLGKIHVVDAVGGDSNVPVSFRLLAGDKEIASGMVENGAITIPTAKLSTGACMVELIAAGASTVKNDIVLWSKNDKRPPVETSLWVPVGRIVAPSGKEEVEVTVGSSYPGSWILCQKADAEGKVETEWLQVDSQNKTVKVRAPQSGSVVQLALLAMHNLTPVYKQVVIESEDAAARVKIAVESFRDKITPGNREQWRFRVDYAASPYAGAVVVATMTNKALNAIVPFKWNVPFVGRPYVSAALNALSEPWSFRQYFNFSKNVTTPRESVCLPQWNFYGQGLLGMAMVENTVYYKNAVMMKSAATMDLSRGVAGAADDMIEEESAEAAEAVEQKDVQESGEDMPLRDSECPIAFFMPDLKTNEKGILDINFVVPNFNTTWTLQLAAASKNAKFGFAECNSVSSKPVMAQTNTPRFLRTGDSIVLHALLLNATDSARSVSGRMEVFDVATGKILAEKDFEPEMLRAKGNRKVDISFSAPDDTEMLGLRTWAISDEYRDGEQALVGILPSSTPVIDATTFYLAPDASVFEMEMPKEMKGARVSLEYCGNPIWYCVTALPALASIDSDNIFALADKFFSNSLIKGIAGAYPQIGEALSYWKSLPVSPLVSPLQQNRDKKIIGIDVTPWVNDASAETMRMKRLDMMFDSAVIGNATSDALSKLVKKQQPGGGWSWCDGMEASEWVTMSVIEKFAALKRLGSMPEEAKNPVVKGIKFVDSKIVEDYRRAPKYFVPISMLGYLYVRTAFNVSATTEFSSLRTKSINAILKGWKALSVSGKATAAIVLHKSGYTMKAREIMESLRQFAMTSPTQGMWYDNIGGGWNGMGRLETTVRVMSAFEEILPADESIGQLRQWLILQRRTQDWGGGSSAAQVVASILQSDPEWSATTEFPEIKIGSDVVAPNKFEKYTCSLFRDIEASEGVKITISSRSCSAAWGGVMSQYIMPIKDVKSAAVEELKVEKTIYKIVENDGGTELVEGPINPGDKVRVVLNLTATRDIDYVALMDARAACLEPCEQISGYVRSDQTSYYREVRNASTNLFIGYLRKGSHILTYDCYVSQQGSFASGISAAQSLYAPMVTAHSAGEVMMVNVQ